MFKPHALLHDKQHYVMLWKLSIETDTKLLHL